MTHLSIEQWRIIVDICDFHGEGADTLQTGITLIGGLNCDGHELAIISLAIEYLVGGHLSGLLVHRELCAFLIWLLNNWVFHLSKNMQNGLVIDTNYY